jgi:competence protein ComEC
MKHLIPLLAICLASAPAWGQAQPAQATKTQSSKRALGGQPAPTGASPARPSATSSSRAPIQQPVPSGELELHVIDLKIHGESLLLRTPGGKIVLVDAGLPASKKLLVKTLRKLGVSAIDLLILTHSDIDHLGGMRYLAGRFPVEHFWRPGFPLTRGRRKKLRKLTSKLKTSGGAPTPVEVVARGTQFPIDGVNLNVVAPFLPFIRNAESDLNANSVVLMVEYGSSRWLLTGDAEKATERELIASGTDLRCQLLKIGHHGSKSSSSLPFLKATGATLAAISSNPPIAHPHKPVIANMRAAGLTWFRTDLNDHLLFTTPGDGTLKVRYESGSPNEAGRGASLLQRLRALARVLKR